MFFLLQVAFQGEQRFVEQAAHRPELFAPQGGTVTPELLAGVLNREALADVYFLNQTDLRGMQAARRLAALLERPSVCGSLREGVLECLY